MIISIFTPHGGCPERCRFCDQKTSGGSAVPAAGVRETIEEHLSTADESGAADEIAFYGGTFTAMPKERQTSYLEAARPYLEGGRVGSVRISTRPDAIEEAWLAELRDRYGLRTVELGIQSFTPQVLRSLGRSHSVKSAGEAVAVLRRLSLKIGAHLMIGCPDEPEDEDARLIAGLESIRPDVVRLHPLVIIKGTPLEERWRTGEYEPLSLERAIERAAALVEAIEERGMQVIRLGLQDNEALGARVVAGPHHPAFGDLARGRVLCRSIARSFEMTSTAGRDLAIAIDRRLAGRLRGPRGTNVEWLREKLELRAVFVNEIEKQGHWEARLA